MMKIIETILRERFELHVDEELGFDKRKLLTTKQFLNFCCEELGIETKFECYIVADRAAHGIKTTAYYDLDSHDVKVFGKNRMLGDIFRSIAHELTHLHQNEEGRIGDHAKDGADGSDIENEANAKAGEIIRKFGREHANIFEAKIL